MDQKHAPDEAFKDGKKEAVNQPRVPVIPL